MRQHVTLYHVMLLSEVLQPVMLQPVLLQLLVLQPVMLFHALLQLVVLQPVMLQIGVLQPVMLQLGVLLPVVLHITGHHACTTTLNHGTQHTGQCGHCGAVPLKVAGRKYMQREFQQKLSNLSKVCDVKWPENCKQTSADSSISLVPFVLNIYKKRNI